MMRVPFYDAKVYDHTYFSQAQGADRLQWEFHDFTLSAKTVGSAEGGQVVCVFVNDRVDRGCIEGLSRAGVKLIALRCAGYNNVDLGAAKELRIAVTRVPSYSPHAVAEHAVGLFLTLNRKIHRAYNRVRDLNFSLNGLAGFDVYGKTVGIIGTGKIGKVTAQIFRGFGTRVLAHDVVPDAEWAGCHGVEYVDFKTLLRLSDVISLHVPLYPELFHMFGKDTFSAMKPGAFLINTSRGKLVDTKAMIDALKDGRLGGVALDVYEEEEGIFFEDHSGHVLKDDDLSRLLSFPNVLITSHQAFFTHEAMAEIARVTVENILRLESGKPFLEGTVL
jgi:D-lactate dehydrogenase